MYTNLVSHFGYCYSLAVPPKKVTYDEAVYNCGFRAAGLPEMLGPDSETDRSIIGWTYIFG